MALYEEAKKEEKDAPSLPALKAANKYAAASGAIVARLRGCTAQNLQDGIALLLEKEHQSLKIASHLPIPKPTPGLTMTALIRTERVKALMDAAGNGKNLKARSPLWEIIETDKDDYYGQLAAVALGKIGDPADLDRLLAMIKDNPRLRLPITGFPNILAPRIIKEMTAPGISPEVKGHLSLVLRESSTHENIGSYLPLLKSTDTTLAQTASEAIDRSVQSSDEEMIENKFKSRSAYDRIGVIIAVGEHAWSDKYVPLLVNALLQDPDQDARKLAAQYLGLHKVKSALPALQEATTKDKAYSVRLAASVAGGRIIEAK
jgi:HEAT repeat protein